MLIFIMLLLSILILAVLIVYNMVVDKNDVGCNDATLCNYSEDEVSTRIKEYRCNIEVESYCGVAIWRLNHKTECYPWHAFVDGRNQDFDSLEEAKKAIDNYQIIRKQRLEEYCKKYPDLTKYKY